MFNLLKGDITDLRKTSLKRQNVVGFKYSILLQYFTDEYYYYYYYYYYCLLYTSPSPRDQRGSRMPSSA